MRRIPTRGIVPVAVLAAAAVILEARAANTLEELQPVTAPPSAETGVLTNETTKLWFVEYPSAPLADGNSDAALDHEHTAFHNEASSQGVRVNERMRFKSLWNGISVQATAGEIARIRQFSSVKAVYPVQTHAMPRTTSVSPDLATAIQMTRADIAQSELGLTGRGVRVAVMDTGIDYDNPDLGPGFGRGKRVSTGWDFVGDKYNADPTSATYDPVPHPDANPDDCAGHGTHVAGIIGAKGQVTGVAPGVTFGAYRVFGCEGSTSDDIMLAAMERILKDRMDVLNMSIGDAFNNWPGAPTAAAASRLVRKGVVVVASIGNSGANGLWAAGAPGVGEGVIGVASFDNLRSTNPAFSVSPDNTLVGFDQATAAPIAPRSGSPIALAKTGTPATANDGCSAFTPAVAATLAGKMVLIRRGTCGFFVKATNAQNAGAAGVILYNNTSGRINPTVAGATPIKIPVVAITAADGKLINDRIEGAPAGTAITMTWTNQLVHAPNTTTANLISSFSSYGLAADLTLKPDIGAPGGFIWSTLPLEQGGHGSLSGTSMASPHVAGAVALLLEARRDLRRQHGNNDDDGNDESWRDGGDDDNNVRHAATVRDILQNSARPKVWAGNPALGFLDNVQRQGAGMLDIASAVLATSSVVPGKLSLGEGTGPVTRSITVRNGGRSSVTYAVSHQNALANGPKIFVPNFFAPSTSVAFSAASFTLRSGESRRIDVTITPDPLLADNSIYGGYLVLTPDAGDRLSVPYVGFKGDYQSIQILNETILGGTPLLLDADLNDVKPDHVFTLKDADKPSIAYHMDLQARRLVVLVVDTATGQTLGRAVDYEYVHRNATSTGIFAEVWDGTYMPGAQGTQVVKTAPNGTYKLVLAVEKPLAEKNNPKHVESWTSAVFQVTRP